MEEIIYLVLNLAPWVFTPIDMREVKQLNRKINSAVDRSTDVIYWKKIIGAGCEVDDWQKLTLPRRDFAKFYHGSADDITSMKIMLALHGPEWGTEKLRTCATMSAEAVRFLLEYPLVDPSVGYNVCIRRAVEGGREDIVELLLADPRVDPSDYENNAVKTAAGLGHENILKMLLKDPRVDPMADGNSAARWAFSNGYVNTFKILLEHRAGR